MTPPENTIDSNPTTPSTTDPRVLSLAPAQADLQALVKIVPDAALAFFETITLRLKGPFDAERWSRSLEQVLERYPLFRAGLTPQGDCLLPEDSETLARSGIQRHPDAASLKKSEEQLHRLWRSGLAIPLFQAAYASHSPDLHELKVTVHRLLADRAGLLLFLRTWWSALDGDLGELGLLPEQASEGGRGTISENGLEGWKQCFPEGFPLLELPLDRPRPMLFSHRGECVRVRWDRSEQDAFCSQSGAPSLGLENVMLVLFHQLLRRLSRQDQLVIGVEGLGAVEGGSRSLSRNALLWCSQLGNRTPVREAVGIAQKEWEQMGRLPEVPFSSLLRHLGISRNSSRPPVFAAAFSFEREPQEWGLGRFEIQQCLDAGGRLEGTCRVDLELRVSWAASGDLYLDWIYSSDLLDGETVKRWAKHFETLWRSYLQHPELPLEQLAMLTPQEETLLVEEWNKTERPVPRGRRLHEWFEMQVAQTPAKVALVSERGVLTYTELNRRSNQVAATLQQRGVVPGSRVGIFLDRHDLPVIAMLGVLKTGAAYLPLDPEYPRERLAFMLTDADVGWVLTEQSLRSTLPSTMADVVVMDDPASLQPAPVNAITVSGSDTDLAYLIYTSGSTGLPKGVMLEHRNAVAFVAWALEVFTPEEMAGVLCSTSFCFDLSVFEIYVPLCCGGTVIMGETGLRTPALPTGTIATCINTSPSIVAQALREGLIPATVRIINLAGELLRTELVDQLYEGTRVEKVYDLYGPTEDTTYSTYTLRRSGCRPSIGRPIANTQVYLLDALLRPVPIGVAGELHLSGMGLARGYWKRPELTAERFIPNPFRQGERLYRTGDLARYRPDGTLEYLGRIDHQIKVNGVRIEPGEIESSLLRIDGVEDAVVMARGETDSGRRLIGYVVLKSGISLSSAALRETLRRTLPLHLVPAELIILPSFPRTPSGKLDRAALPLPSTSNNSPLSASTEPPQNSTEEWLLQLWKELLKVDRAGVEDDFFALGGHSLIAMQVTRRIYQNFGIKLSLRALFEAPTIRELARVIGGEEHLRGGRDSRRGEVQP